MPGMEIYWRFRTVSLSVSNGKTKYFSIIVLFYFSFVRLLRLVDGRMRAHRPNASFSGVRSTVCGRFPGGLPPPRPPATMA